MHSLNSIWEYIIPALIFALVCAFMANKRDKDPFIWFLLGLIFNFIALILIGGYPFAKKQDRQYEETKSDPVLSMGLIVSSMLLFIWSALSLVVIMTTIVQDMNAAPLDQLTTSDYSIIGWNLIVTSVYIVIGIGVLKLKHWGYSWGIGSSLLNTLLYFVYSQHNPLDIVMLILQIAILVLLFLCRKDFGGYRRIRLNNATELTKHQ